MVGVEAPRHALFRRTLELVSLLLDALDDAIERAAAALVHDRVAVPLQELGLGEVETDGKLNTSWREVEPIAGRALLLAAFPPPERLVVLVWLLVTREADVSVDPLHAVVRPRIDLKLRAKCPKLRTQIDHEFLRRLEHLLFIVGAVLIEPLFAVVATQSAEKPRRTVWKSIVQKIPSTFRAIVRSDAMLSGARSRRACFSSARIARSACRSSSSAPRTS